MSPGSLHDACKCCGGVPLHVAAIERFLGRVSVVLDENEPMAFAFHHSGHYQGLLDEVAQFRLEHECSLERFDSAKAKAHGVKTSEERGCSPIRGGHWNSMSRLAGVRGLHGAPMQSDRPTISSQPSSRPAAASRKQQASNNWQQCNSGQAG